MPVFFSYLVITSTAVHLFLEEHKITPEVREHFQREGLSVAIHAYKDVLQKFVEIVSTPSQMYCSCISSVPRLSDSEWFQELYSNYDFSLPLMELCVLKNNIRKLYELTP